MCGRSEEARPCDVHHLGTECSFCLPSFIGCVCVLALAHKYTHTHRHTDT